MSEPCQVILAPFGSSGDINPFIGLGCALRQRGHRVTIVLNEYFAPIGRDAGLNVVSSGGADEYQAAMANPDLWVATRGFKVVARMGMVPAMRPMYEVLNQLHESTGGVLVAPVMQLAARLLQETRGAPLVTVHLQPVALRTLHQMPVMPAGGMPRWTPKFVKRAFYWLASSMIDAELAPALNAFRRELGLPPVRDIMTTWWDSPAAIIGMFPDWYAPRQPDWPAHLHLTGFPLYDAIESMVIPAELAAFLAKRQPIVFTAGTAMRHARDFFEASAAACERLRRPGLLVTKHAEQLPRALPENVLACGYVPFSQLLPRAAAIVHHGGIGTLSQALAAGIPQLVTPYAHDQPDNADRLRRLGVGKSLAPRRYGPKSAARALAWLLGDPRVAENCQKWRAKMEASDSLESACRVIERVAQEAAAPAKGAGAPKVAGVTS